MVFVVVQDGSESSRQTMGTLWSGTDTAAQLSWAVACSDAQFVLRCIKLLLLHSQPRELQS